MQGPFHNVGPVGGDRLFLEQGLGNVVQQVEVGEIIVIVTYEMKVDVPNAHFGERGAETSRDQQQGEDQPYGVLSSHLLS